MRSVTVHESKKSGFIITEQGDIENWVLWPNAVIAFDHWWPEETYWSLAGEVWQAIDKSYIEGPGKVDFVNNRGE